MIYLLVCRQEGQVFCWQYVCVVASKKKTLHKQKSMALILKQIIMQFALVIVYRIMQNAYNHFSTMKIRLAAPGQWCNVSN